jgi:molecular chaperone GrpE
MSKSRCSTKQEKTMYWSDIDYVAPRKTPRKIPVRGSRNGVSGEKHTMARSNSSAEAVKPANGQAATPTMDQINWQETALRLQAEMDNSRKRQERRATEAIVAERVRLLSLFLPVVDNLTRALNHDAQTDETLRQGVELTQRELLRLLEAEGVTRLETVGQSFDPEWHEAVSAVPADVEPDTVVEEIEAGYKLGDKLLRPAKVVVAA